MTEEVKENDETVIKKEKKIRRLVREMVISMLNDELQDDYWDQSFWYQFEGKPEIDKGLAKDEIKQLINLIKGVRENLPAPKEEKKVDTDKNDQVA